MQHTSRLVGGALAIAVLITASSCAHHKDVRPGVDGVHRVQVRKPTKEESERDALDQSSHYCEEVHKKTPAVVDEKTQYTGTMDEGTRDTVNKASKAAMILGGAGSVAGSGATQTGGTVLGGAGTAGTVMTSGNDYLTEMRFKCQ